MKIDIKTLIVLASVAVTIGGFYYGTEYRLSTLEQKTELMEAKNSELEKRIQKISKRLKRVEK